MRKLYQKVLAAIFICGLATISFVSCTTVEDNPVVPEPQPQSMTPFGDLLQGVDNITSINAFTPSLNNVGFTEFYEVFFRQPVDHENPAAGTMKQKAFIFFKGFDRPTVMYTRGYDLPDNWKNFTHLDIAANMDANLIFVEHRYFGDSKNLGDTRWDYLTIEQAAADHHAIFQALKPLLPKEWISTGTSKDGMTSLFYRYFYPNDMTVTTVFCSPFMTSLHYMPVGTYMQEESGSDAERENMHAIFFKLLDGVLANENTFYDTYVQKCEEYNAQLQALHPEHTDPWFNSGLDYYVGFLPEFFFGQFSYHTAKERALNIPSADAEPEVILDYIYFRDILTQNGLWQYDSPLAPAAEEEDYYWKADSGYPYCVQTAKQLGQYCHDFSRYESLIQMGQNPNPSALYEQDLWIYDTYDNSRIKDIRENFLPKTECPILFYYAQGDPWTGARPDKINESNTMLLIGERGIHNQDLNNPEHFSQDDKQQIMDFLARYVDYENATTNARRSSSADLPTVSIEPDYFVIRRR